MEKFRLATRLPVNSHGKVDFYYGYFFERTEGDHTYNSVEHGQQPSVLNKFI